MHARGNVDIVKIILTVNIQMDCVLLVVTMAIMATFVKPVRVLINECQCKFKKNQYKPSLLRK